MKVSAEHVTSHKLLRYVQIYEGTQRHVTKQALRYLQIYERTSEDMFTHTNFEIRTYYMKVPQTCLVNKVLRYRTNI